MLQGGSPNQRRWMKRRVSYPPEAGMAEGRSIELPIKTVSRKRSVDAHVRTLWFLVWNSNDTVSPIDAAMFEGLNVRPLFSPTSTL